MPAPQREKIPLHTQIEQLNVVRHERPSRYVATAHQVEPLPPWDSRREWITAREVPVFLRKLYGIKIGNASVVSWRRDGVEAPTPSDPNRRVYLVTTRVGNYRMVRKSDLLAFLELD